MPTTSASSSNYKAPALCLFLSVGTYYSLQAFVPENTKARARRVVKRLIRRRQDLTRLLWGSKEESPRRRSRRRGEDLTRGDGLQSIFSNSTLLLDDCDGIINKSDGDIPEINSYNNREESDLNEVQQIAFDSLLACGVIDSSIGLGVLKATLRNAKLLHKAPGDFIFKHDDDYREDILVLKSGACEVLYHNDHNSDEESSVVVSVISERRVLASVVDIVSWIIGHSSFQCNMSVRCTEACEVIAIPSPHHNTQDEGEEGGEGGQPLHSSLYVCSYANLVRSLLIRFSRTTITSSLFYLGLAEHM